MDEKKKHTYEVVRKFLLCWYNKDFLIFLFFLALSSMFWLMMTLNETYEQEVCVPVQLVGTPGNVIVTTEIEDTIRVTVRDKGYTLAMYKYGDGVKPIKVNFGTYANKTTGYGLVPPADLQKLAYQRIGGASRITAIKPDRLDFYFSRGRKKTVPVRMAGKVTPAKSYYLARVRFWPETVTVYASEKLLDSIKYVTTEPLHITNFTDTLIRQVSLAKVKGVKTVPSTIRVGLYPDILTEESVEVPIQAINMPDGKILRTFPSKVRVHFDVGASMFRTIDTRHFTVVTDYRDILAHPSSKCTLYLRTMPHGVRNARLEMQQVDYLIEQQ